MVRETCKACWKTYVLPEGSEDVACPYCGYQCKNYKCEFCDGTTEKIKGRSVWRKCSKCKNEQHV